MHFKLLFVCYVLNFICVQVKSSNENPDPNETITNVDDFKYRIEKTITSVNSNYKNLIPEKKFAAHLMKKVINNISENLKTEIINTLNNLDEANNTDFSSCTNELDTSSIIQSYSGCIQTLLDGSGQEIAENLTQTINLAESKLAEITKQDNECDKADEASICKDEVLHNSQEAYKVVLLESNEVEKLILRSYQNTVEQMPQCASQAIFSAFNVDAVFKCVVKLVQNKD